MPEIDNITPVFDAADMGDEDLLVIHSASEDAGGTVSTADFIAGNGLAKDGGDPIFDVTKVGALAFASGKQIESMVAGSLTVTLADTLTETSQTVTATLTGAATDMFMTAALTEALPDGLLLQGAWISAGDTISFKVYNATGGTITGASYTAQVMAFAVGDYVAPS